MPDLKPQENQQELFPVFSGEPRKAERFPSLGHAQKPILISTNAEQLILAGIVLVLMSCLFFFLGVLRGKAIAPRERVVVSAPAVSAAQRLPQKVAPFVATTVLSSIPQKASGNTITIDISKPYTIQLVTHKKKSYAERDVSALRRGGFFSFIIPSGEYYQVCVGQYQNKEEAQKELRFFAGKYKDCFLRRR